ncbi:MAG: electron transport complex subunit RsxA, partial [Oscillospiraceae bacterium]|nr:electron transport complex subunit RsxA [Oscillospiraceae bacterium]
MYITKILAISLGAILVNNFVLVQFLGICPFMGVSKKMDTAVGMGFAVTFVMALASALCYPVNQLLIALDLEYMQTVAFILVIASLVQLVEMFLKKAVPALYDALGVYLPLITTNCAVLGVVLLNTQEGYSFIESVVYGATGGLGFLLAIVLFASIRELL